MNEDVPVDCPVCGEENWLQIDTRGGDVQRFTEDCTVCCRPMAVQVHCRPGAVESVWVDVE